MQAIGSQVFTKIHQRKLKLEIYQTLLVDNVLLVEWVWTMNF